MTEYIHTVYFDTHEDALQFATAVGLDTSAIGIDVFHGPWYLLIPDSVYKSRVSREYLDYEVNNE